MGMKKILLWVSIALAGAGVLIVVRSEPKETRQSTQPTPIRTAARPRPAPPPDGRAAFGVNVAGGGRAILLVEGAQAQLCVEGDRWLTPLDLADGTLLYATERGLYAVGLDCRKPRLLLRQENVGCAAIDPKGRWIIASSSLPHHITLIDRRGGATRALGPGWACSWVDQDHVLKGVALQVTPSALRTDGAPRLLADADVWRGVVSPSSRAAIVPTYDPVRAWGHIAVTPSGRVVALPAEVRSDCHEQIAWEPGGARVIYAAHYQYYILDERGRVVHELFDLPSCATRLAMMDESVVIGLVTSSRGSPRAYYETRSGRRTPIRLPPGVRSDLSPVVIVERTLVERTTADMFTSIERYSTRSDEERGLRFRLPPGWSIDTWCRTPFRPDRTFGRMTAVCATWPPLTGHTPNWTFAYTTTAADPASVIAVFREQAPQASCAEVEGPPCGTISEGRVSLGSNRFRFLDISLWEGRDVYLAARFGGRTLVIHLGNPFHKTDATVRAVLASFRSMS